MLLSFIPNLKMAITYFIRCRVLLILYSVITFFLTGWIFYNSIGVPGLNSLSYICQLQFYIQIFIVCTAYEYFKRFSDRSIDETLSAATGGRPVYSVYLFIWQIFTALSIQLLMVLAMIFSALLDGNQAYFMGWMWKPVIINMLLPTVISVLLAYILAFKANRLVSYGLILVFLFMISPYAELMIWVLPPAGFPIDQVVKYLHWPFTILYQNASSGPDYQYGFQTELPRILVQLFWIVLLLGLSPIMNSLRINRKVKLGIATGSTLLACVMLIASFQPACLYRQSRNWDGVRANVIYYGYYDPVRKSELGLKISQNPGFKVTEYHVSADLNLDLDVSMTLDIQAERPMSDFVMTLYHGYRVTSAKIENGATISYEQTGDSLTFSLPEPTDKVRISLSYSGYDNKFYSNSDGAMLPGYFPWYPMAGIHQIFIRPASGGYGYNPYNRVEETDFYLTVKNGGNVVTNLNKATDGSYSGKSDGLSLFAGNIIMSDDSHIKSLLPLMYYEKYTESDAISFYKTSLTEIFRSIKDFVKYDISSVEKKPVIIVSYDLYRNYLIGGYADFSDYILIAEGACSEDTIVRYYNNIIPTRKGSILCDILIRTISGSADQTLAKMYNYFQFLQEQKDSMIKQGIDFTDNDAALALFEQLKTVVEKRGAQIVVEALNKYMTDLNKQTDDQAFLQTLLKGE